MRAEVQAAVDEVNSKVGTVEQVKRFKILPRDLTQETGDLTPTLKVKRNVVSEKNAAEIDALYAGERAPNGYCGGVCTPQSGSLSWALVPERLVSRPPAAAIA